MKTKKNGENANVKNTNNVKTFIENAADVLAGFKVDVKNGNKEYFSLSGVLKDMQRSANLNAGYAKVLNGLHFPTNKKCSVSDFKNILHADMIGKDKKGEEFIGMWAWKIEKDEDGNEKSREKVLRKISSFTPNKIFKIIAQSNELKKNAK